MNRDQVRAEHLLPCTTLAPHQEPPPRTLANNHRARAWHSTAPGRHLRPMLGGMTGLSPEEHARRRPVWDALSELFLDTETRWFLPRIAQVLCESGYTDAELEGIWRHEMIPECGWNLAQVAGEWAAMPYDEAALARRAASGLSWLDRIKSASIRRMLAPQWRALLELRRRLLTLDQAHRQARADLWEALLHAYLEENLERMIGQDRHEAALRAGAANAAEALRLFTGELRPLAAPLLVSNERNAEAQRAAQVEALIQGAFTQP